MFFWSHNRFKYSLLRENVKHYLESFTVSWQSAQIVPKSYGLPHSQTSFSSSPAVPHISQISTFVVGIKVDPKGAVSSFFRISHIQKYYRINFSKCQEQTSAPINEVVPHEVQAAFMIHRNSGPVTLVRCEPSIFYISHNRFNCLTVWVECQAQKSIFCSHHNDQQGHRIHHWHRILSHTHPSWSNG